MLSRGTMKCSKSENGRTVKRDNEVPRRDGKGVPMTLTNKSMVSDFFFFFLLLAIQKMAFARSITPS